MVAESSEANGMEIDGAAAAAAAGQQSRKIYVGNAGVDFVRDNMQVRQTAQPRVAIACSCLQLNYPIIAFYLCKWLSCTKH